MSENREFQAFWKTYPGSLDPREIILFIDAPDKLSAIWSCQAAKDKEALDAMRSEFEAVRRDLHDLAPRLSLQMDPLPATSPDAAR